MATTMTVPEVQQWMAQVADAGKWGWLPENRKIAAHLRRQTRARFQLHMSPEGAPWPKLFVPPSPAAKTGSGPIRIGGDGKAVYAKLTTDAQIARSDELWKKNKRYYIGPNTPALYRARRIRGAHKAVRLFTALTRDRVPGSATRIGRTFLDYGLTPQWSRWAGVHQSGGGSFKHRPVPRREVLGLIPSDVAFIENTYAAGVDKRLQMDIRMSALEGGTWAKTAPA